MKRPSIGGARHLPLRRSLLAGLLAAPFIRPAAAEWQPNRPIRILRGFPPGSIGDAILRKIADALMPALGRPVVIESRAGAGGNIAMDALAKAPPDGHTLAMTPIGPVIINPLLMAGKMAYDPERAFTPLLHISDHPLGLVGHSSLPPSTPEILDWLRRHPDAAYGTPGIGSTHHLLGETLSRAMALRLRHAPYRGSQAALLDLVAGQVMLAFDLVGNIATAVNEGQVRGIAVTSPARSPLLPAVPTFAELGLPQMAASSWLGLFAPAGLPAEIGRRLTDALNAVLAEPGFAAWLAERGGTPVGGDAAGFQAFLAAERPRWAEVVRTTGVTLE